MRGGGCARLSIIRGYFSELRTALAAIDILDILDIIRLRHPPPPAVPNTHNYSLRTPSKRSSTVRPPRYAFYTPPFPLPGIWRQGWDDTSFGFACTGVVVNATARHCTPLFSLSPLKLISYRSAFQCSSYLFEFDFYLFLPPVSASLPFILETLSLCNGFGVSPCRSYLDT